MKKYIISIFAIMLGVSMTSSAIASTNLTLVPNTVNVVAGQKVDLVIYANSNGIKNGIVKVEVSYPVNLLGVSSFVQSPTWMSNTESGYDSIDNTNGLLIKTAGYPRGFISTVPFGTITFIAKEAGVATVKVTNGSIALDASGRNAFSGNSQSVINITTAIGTVTTTTKVSTTTISNPNLTGQEATVVDALRGTSTDNTKLTASAFGSMMGGNIWYFIGGLLLLAIILLILFLVEKRKRDKKNNKLNK